VTPLRSPNFDEIKELHEQLVDMRIDYWLEKNLFTLQWWILLFVLIIPWAIWWKLVDKKRIHEILLFGSFLTVLVLLLDNLGVELILWSYPHQLVSIIPSQIPVDNGIIIVAHMLIYQYFRRWQTFITANIVMALIFTFVAEPITVWLEIYRLDNWEYIYSLPIYILKAVMIKALVQKVFSLSQKGGALN
jgi:hypothetical protein